MMNLQDTGISQATRHYQRHDQRSGSSFVIALLDASLGTDLFVVTVPSAIAFLVLVLAF
jgi:hypothetical protein